MNAEELKLIIEMISVLGTGAMTGFVIWILVGLLKALCIVFTVCFCVRTMKD